MATDFWCWSDLQLLNSQMDFTHVTRHYVYSTSCASMLNRLQHLSDQENSTVMEADQPCNSFLRFSHGLRRGFAPDWVWNTQYDDECSVHIWDFDLDNMKDVPQSNSISSRRNLIHKCRFVYCLQLSNCSASCIEQRTRTFQNFP